MTPVKDLLSPLGYGVRAEWGAGDIVHFVTTDHTHGWAIGDRWGWSVEPNPCVPECRELFPDTPRVEFPLPLPDTLRIEASVQVGGDHYERMPVQPWAIIDAFGLDFYTGNALKYLLRSGRKPGSDPVEDLRKARHYLDQAIERASP